MAFHIATWILVGLMVLIAAAPGMLPGRWEAVQFFGFLAVIGALYATRGKNGPG